MKVSRKSWHYRLHVFAFTVFNLDSYGPIAYAEGKRWEHQPSNLCRYFWSTLTLLALTVALAPIAAFVTVAILIVAYTYVGCTKVRDAYRRRRPAKEKPIASPSKPPREPGLIRQFVRARKSKVCPLIELVD